MLPNLVKGKGISGTVRYVLGQGKGRGADWHEGQESRVDWISGQGFGFDIKTRDDADLGRRIMEFAAVNQASRTKPCDVDALHLSLSWHPNQQPTREQMEQAARDALKTLGMENARAIFVAHNDTAMAHVHIVASRINPETGRAFNDWEDVRSINKWAHEYEKVGGIIYCPRRELPDLRDPEIALRTITNEQATFNRRELDRLLYKVIVSRAERRELTDKILSRDDVIPLRESADAPITRYTTREVLRTEAELLRDARRLHDDTRYGVTSHQLDQTLDLHSHLDREQREALFRTTGPEGFAIITGEAGTGKSTTIEAVRHAYEQAGYKVRGLAPTHAVKEDLKKAGFIEPSTIAAELMRQEKGIAEWNARTVLIVDEAAMLSTRNLGELIEQAHHRKAKVVLVGDDKQLASIDRGGMFSSLRDEHGAAELHEVRRVSDAEQKRAFNHMHLGDFETALGIFEQQGAIHWTANQNAAREALLAKYTADATARPDQNRFVFAYTNAAVDAINQDVRGWRRERGELGPDHEFHTKHGVASFAEGDRIQFTGNAQTKSARDIGFTNGVTGTVRDIDGQRMTVELDGKRHGKERLVEFTVGDNAEAGQFNAIRHGHAGTIYKGQGKSLSETYLYHSEHWRRASSYVALTRHRETLSVFVGRDTVPDLEQLARQMSRVDEKRAASQFHRDDIGKDRENRNTGGEQREAERKTARAALEEALKPQRPEPGAARNDRKRDPGIER
jgi:Ti-type conjugative transfer relaxase TraA